jgi:hypothetical protein
MDGVARPFPLGPPPSAVGGQTACVYQAEPDQTDSARLTPFDRLKTNGEWGSGLAVDETQAEG